jgi:predicted ATPase
VTTAKRTLSSVRIRNFKAIEDTGILEPAGLSVFIGDNGVGKSSVLEALSFTAALSHETLDGALDPFGGYEHLRWKGGKRLGRATPEAPFKEYHPIQISLRGHVGRVSASAFVQLSGQNRNIVTFDREELKVGADRRVRAGEPQRPPARGRDGEGPPEREPSPDRSILWATSWFDDWQFLDMVPGRMGQPVRRARERPNVRLSADGANLAEYLLDLRNADGGVDAFNGLVETLQVILPYARDMDTVMTQMLERQVALRLHEGGFSVPGWMLSTGTLRLVALLALLRHPRPPSLLCVEEIENGLDPRTIHLVVEELREAAESGRTQILVTTHSPYLLDLVPLESLVLVARDGGGPPRFDRPAEHEEVREWAKRFAPGRLYTMGTLHEKRGGQ